MADDKKPEKKKSPLYDAPKGEPKHGARKSESAKPADDVKPKADAKPADKDPTAEKAPEKPDGNPKAAAPKDQKGEESAKKDAGGEAKPVHPAAERLSGIHRRQESERRDFHGNTREAFRQMASRHMKELKDFETEHLASLTANNAPAPGAVPGNEPTAPQAQAPAAAAPKAV